MISAGNIFNIGIRVLVIILVVLITGWTPGSAAPIDSRHLVGNDLPREGTSRCMGSRDSGENVRMAVLASARNGVEWQSDANRTHLTVESPKGGKPFMVAAGQTSGKDWKGKKGSTVDNPIVIKGASTTVMGVRTEYAIVRSLFGAESRVVEQDLLEHNGKKIDRLSVKLKTGETVKVFFDITAFYGKFTE